MTPVSYKQKYGVPKGANCRQAVKKQNVERQMEAVRKSQAWPAETIAQRFVQARLSGSALPDYPGSLPPDLEAAYVCQDIAIGLWPDTVAGWKIGRIQPEHEAKVGAKSLAGPIFRNAIQRPATGSLVEFGIFVGGFAAVEAEFLFEVCQDAPPGKLAWSMEDAEAIAGRMLVGVELAGSPLRTINALGPKVIVSDFGNNNGLIVGPEIANWRSRALADLTCETFIYGKSVGKGSAANVPNGPLASLRFVAELCARRSRPLKSGMLISTGAATGVHDIKAGEVARVEFHGLGAIQCVAKPLPVKAG